MKIHSQKDDYGNLKEKIISVRLESVASATSRTRRTFLIMTIFCAAINIALWNGYLSWIRGIAMPKMESGQTTENSEVKNPMEINAEGNKKVLVDEWIRSQTISFNLLGIKLTTFDLSVLGSISLVIVMIWYFFAIRRENRTIVPFLKEISDEVKRLRNERDKHKRQEAADLANLVFLGIVNNIVFINIADNDNPSTIVKDKEGNIEISFKSDTTKTVVSLLFIVSGAFLLFLSFLFSWVLSFIYLTTDWREFYDYLNLILLIILIGSIAYYYLTKKRNLVKRFLRLTNKMTKARNAFLKKFFLEEWWGKNENEAILFRWIIYLLIFLPSLTVFLIILSDISSLFNYSAFREPKLGWLIQNIWHESPKVIYKIIVFELVAFISFLMLSFLSLRIVNFSRAIRFSLNTFYKEFIDVKKDKNNEIIPNPNF